MQRSYCGAAIVALILASPTVASSASWSLGGHGLSSDCQRSSTDSNASGTSFRELFRSGRQETS